MPPDPGNSLVELKNAVNDLRETVEAVEAKGREGGEDHAKLLKIHTALDKQEEVSAKLTQDFLDLKAEADQVADLKESLEASGAKQSEIQEALETLQVEMAARASGTPDPNDKAWKGTDPYKALGDWAMIGRAGMSDERKQLLRTDSAVSGGVLVPDEMETFITREVIELNQFRALARVRVIGGKSIDIPIRTTLPTATFEGEAEAGGDSVSQYQNETLTPVRQHVAIPITQDQLQDSAFDMEAEISTDASLAFAVGEGTAHVSGSGVKEPFGFLNDTRIGGITSEENNIIVADDILLLQGQIKIGYAATMVFNRLTLAIMRTFRADAVAADDQRGGYLWSPALDGGAANTIGGMAYRVMPAMPDIADGTIPVAIGDWRRAYTIVDRGGLSVIRDDVTQADAAIVKFTWNKWTTGQVTLAEGIKTLTVQ